VWACIVSSNSGGGVGCLLLHGCPLDSARCQGQCSKCNISVTVCDSDRARVEINRRRL
jgi:hypothetical protein